MLTKQLLNDTYRSIDKLGEESKDFDQDQHTEDKQNQSNIINKIDIESMKMRKHTTTQNVVDKIRFTNREKPEVI